MLTASPSQDLFEEPLMKVRFFFLFLFGFVLGNLFPSFFSDFLGSWSSLFLICFLEFIHSLVAKPRPFLLSKAASTAKRSKLSTDGFAVLGLSSGWTASKVSFARLINSVKIGFLFGLFVDAFKVGS